MEHNIFFLSLKVEKRRCTNRDEFQDFVDYDDGETDNEYRFPFCPVQRSDREQRLKQINVYKFEGPAKKERKEVVYIFMSEWMRLTVKKGI